MPDNVGLGYAQTHRTLSTAVGARRVHKKAI
jgi:hypothetical protein